MKRLISAAFSLLLLCSVAWAQRPAMNTADAAYVKENYTKYEYQIPMRDGKKLFTSVYVPKDQSKKYPFMMDRTCYSVAPYGEDKYKSRKSTKQKMMWMKAPILMILSIGC